MAQFARPDSDVARATWVSFQAPTTVDLWEDINEVTASDTDYVKESEGFNATLKVTLTDVTDPVSSTGHIVRWRAQKTGGGTVTGRVELRQGATLIRSGGTETLTTSWVTRTYTLTATEANNITDYNDLQLWFVAISVPLFNDIRVSWAEFECPNVPPGSHPAPTSVEIDRVATPNNTASDNALFSCIAETTGAETINAMQIQVDDINTFASPIWDSGFLTITNVTDGNRTDEVAYAGAILSEHPVDDKYYVRIKLRDTALVESAWSATAEFKVTKIGWDWAEANMRHVLHWVEDHPALPDGYVQKFEFQTGNRVKVGDNGYFNESVQASGGFQIAYFNNKTHVVWLANPDLLNPNLTIYINSFSWITESWGTPRKIDTVATTFDSHRFPVIAIDGSGFLHIPYGSHDDSFRYTRSRLSNDAGTLPGDTSTDVFIQPKDLPTVTPGWQSIAGFSGTYPIAFYEPTASRMYFFFRKGFNTGEYDFIYSDDEGKTWSAAHTIIDDTVDPYRCYLYGLRYDEVNQRLHVGFTFTEFSPLNRSTGAWYCYSDYGETDGSSLTTAGFNIFRWAHGGLAGRTNAGGAQVEVDRVDGEAILTSTNAESLIFVSTLELDKNNKPVVFFLHHPKAGAATIGSFIDSATYSAPIGSAGTWSVNNLSQQVDLQLRVGRSGIAVMTDRDGVMRMWYPVNAKTPTYFLPTADRDAVGTTVFPATPTTAFDKVDDGVVNVDGDTTYVDLAGGVGTNKVSFDHSKTIDSSYQILDVEVHAMVKGMGAAGACKLYIDNGTTENLSASIAAPADDYTVVSNNWGATNPLTSLAWTTADIDGLEFGVSQNHATVVLRITKVFMAVVYTLSGDDEMFATEIWELQSIDDGVTWTVKKEVTRNTAMGTAIMNHKHRLTNDTIEVIWCSGNDIFYQRDRPYGIVLPTAQDVRLYYGGVEIDRLIDNPNMATTEITFKVQETVLANRRAGPKPLVLYFASPNVTTNAKADPNLVYAEFFDSFETYARGTNMSGTGGWTVGAGTWTVVSSPGPDPTTDHGNKVYAGNNAAYQSTVTGTPNMTHTITANFTDLLLEVAMWAETPISNEHVEVKDGAGNTYRLKLVSGTSTGSWRTQIDAAAELDIGFKGISQQYRNLGIQITTGGASAFVDGVLVQREEAATLTDVDEFTLQTNQLCYFDFIRVSKNPEKSTTVTIDPPTPRSAFAFDTTDSDADDPTNDGLFSSAGVYNRTNKVEVRIGLAATNAGPHTANIKVRVCGGATWDSTNVLASTDLAWTGLGQTTVYKTHTFTFANLKVEGPVCVKLDFYATSDPDPVSMTRDWDWVKVTDMGAPPTIVLQPREVQGWFMDASLTGAGEDFWNMDADISGNKLKLALGALVEWFRGVAPALRGVPVEFKTGRGFLRGSPVEWQRGVAAVLRGAPVEFARAFSFLKGTLVSWRGGVASILRGTPVEFGRGVSFAKGLEVEWSRAVRAIERGAETEWSGGVSLKRGAPVSWKGAAKLLRGTVVSWRTALKGLLRGIEIEWKRGVPSIKRGAEVEFSRRIRAKLGAEVTWLGSAQLTALGTPVEWSVARKLARGLEVEFGKSVPAILRGAEVETSRGLSAGLGGEVEWKRSAAYLRGVEIAWEKALRSVLRGAEIEFSKGESFKRGAPISFDRGLKALLGAEVEWGTSAIVLAFATGIPIEWATQKSIKRGAEIAFSGRLSAGRGALAEWKAGRSILRGGEIEWARGLSAALGAEVEIALKVLSKLGVPIEWAGAAIAAILIVDEDIVLAHHINEAVDTAILMSEDIGIAAHTAEAIETAIHANEEIEVPEYDNMRNVGA